MEQADRRMHKYFAIDQVGQDTWFQPVEELIGRPEFVCDGSGRWHEKIILKKCTADRKQPVLRCRLSPLRMQRKVKECCALKISRETDGAGPPRKNFSAATCSG